MGEKDEVTTGHIQTHATWPLILGGQALNYIYSDFTQVKLERGGHCSEVTGYTEINNLYQVALNMNIVRE